jgi:class 3 adenylate cyclase
MQDDNLQDVLEIRDLDLERLRSPMTILFSDIKDSTGYAEKKGDVEYMAMIDRHNRVLFPIIERESGIVVKTIGDAILAKFDDPKCAVRAAAGMQRALAADREGREEIEQIHIRIGLHHGMGLLKDNDVFGDVVNAASRIEHQAEADQILITDALLEAALAAGFECAKMGRAEMKGKNEPLNLFAVAWSDSATQELIQQIEVRFEKRLKEAKKEFGRLEEEFENARDQWRTERRSLNAEIGQLEEQFERAKDAARETLSEELQSESRFQIEELTRARQQAEQDLVDARQKFEAEKNNLKAQIAGMQASFVDAMERSNNPARMAFAVREQADARVAEAKQEWQLQWEAERKRLNAEIARLSNSASVAAEKKEAARRAVLEKLGKLPASGAASGGKTAEQWEREFQDAKIEWEAERKQLLFKIKKLETAQTHAPVHGSGHVDEAMRAQFEARLEEAKRERLRLEEDIQSVTSELAAERQRLNARIKTLEDSIPVAREVARKQVHAELQSQFDLKLDEASRVRSRMQRQHQDTVEEIESERRRTNKQIKLLEAELKEARESLFRAQKLPG